jgi:hypothetical protein
VIDAIDATVCCRGRPYFAGNHNRRSAALARNVPTYDNADSSLRAQAPGGLVCKATMESFLSGYYSHLLGLLARMLGAVVAPFVVLIAAIPPALAAEPMIGSMVIKLRDGVGVEVNAGLTSDERATLFAAVQAPFSHIGYTRDGALRLLCLNSLPLDAARAAVNRARMLPEVLYANIVPTAPAIRADAGFGRSKADLSIS